MDTSDIKMIVTDLDGTFMDDYFRANDANIQAVARAREKGYRVCANTGRTWTMAKGAVMQADFDDMVMTTNGAAIVNHRTDTYEYLENINPKHVFPILKAIYDAGKRCELLCGNFIASWRWGESQNSRWHDSLTMLFLDDRRVQINRYETLEEMAEACENCTEIIAVDIMKGNSMPQPIVDTLERLGGYDFTVSHDNAMDIISKGVSKAKSLEVLAEIYGLESKNVIAFGDNLNDIEMIQWAGIGVAMENADERLKVHADYIADTNTDGGVAKAMHELLGI